MTTALLVAALLALAAVCTLAAVCVWSTARIARLTGERDRARDVAVALEHELAHRERLEQELTVELP